MARVATEDEWAAARALFAGDLDGCDETGDDETAGGVGPLAVELAALAVRLADATTVAGVLARVVEAARVAVPGADLVSITLRTPEGGFETPVQTNELAERLDEVQYRFVEGPCVAATLDGGPGVAYSADLAAGREYPKFGPVAASLGAHSVLAVGLFPRGETPRFGALNVYSSTPSGLDERDRDIAVLLAAHASTALAATAACTAAELEVAQLREALRTRDVIGQAKGILMERRGVSADEAFDVLRSVSQALNVKLAEVAETLVNRRSEV